MNAQERWLFRLAVLSELVEQAPGRLGRTAIMKLAYFLQTMKDVPLGYHFRLYTYGPYDGDVLTHLSQAEAMHAVKSKVVRNPSGYGYEFERGPKLDEVKGLIKDGLTSSGMWASRPRLAGNSRGRLFHTFPIARIYLEKS